MFKPAGSLPVVMKLTYSLFWLVSRCRPSMFDPSTEQCQSVTYVYSYTAGCGSLSARVLHITVLCVLHHHTSLHKPTDSQYINVLFPTVFSHFYHHVTGHRD